jgi:Calcineurin-like phosphoesterase.
MKHLVIPDCQVRPGDDLTFLERIGKYIVEKQPDVLICLGDFADMPSLSSYDVGRKSFEGRRYLLDVQAAEDGMARLLAPISLYNARQRANGKKQYKPRKVLTLGNHENRINRAVDGDAKLEGVLKTTDLGYADFGWEVHPFLDVAIIDGVAYSHYFVTGVAGRPAGSAAAQFRKTSMSCVAGHQQGLQIHTGNRADGAILTSVIAGSCYEHNEDYLGPQSNQHWRGFLVLHDVKDGAFDLMPVSLSYLEKKYG